jgi:hypothetical protein
LDFTYFIPSIWDENNYLEVKVHAFPQVSLVWETLVLSHVKAERVISVRALPFGEENGVVEPDLFATRQSLKYIFTKFEKKIKF